ncbi:hypothetical protein BpHYR1_024582 [Brachionus plicatilis]|uniref:Uncharacterized protein n=1 Tax=Brachionus plicatilis TaxID=10195 RepID=A0A3M7R064_BRAPC|nr:hypothetical protein BpHYR1_024582 [Brachionus plicatilis]
MRCYKQSSDFDQLKSPIVKIKQQILSQVQTLLFLKLYLQTYIFVAIIDIFAVPGCYCGGLSKSRLDFDFMTLTFDHQCNKL